MALLKQTQLHCFIHVLHAVSRSQTEGSCKRTHTHTHTHTEETPKAYLKVLSQEGKSSWVFLCLCKAETDGTGWTLP